MRLAARAPRIEPRVRYHELHSRPDILALNTTGNLDALDVSVRHCFSSHNVMLSTLRNTRAVVNKMYANKLSKHQAFAGQFEAQVVPIILSHTGGWHPGSHRYAQEIAHEIASNTEDSAQSIKARMFQRIAATLVIGNARALLADMQALMI